MVESIRRFHTLVDVEGERLWSTSRSTICRSTNGFVRIELDVTLRCRCAKVWRDITMRWNRHHVMTCVTQTGQQFQVAVTVLRDICQCERLDSHVTAFVIVYLQLYLRHHTNHHEFDITAIADCLCLYITHRDTRGTKTIMRCEVEVITCHIDFLCLNRGSSNRTFGKFDVTEFILTIGVIVCDEIIHICSPSIISDRS